MSKLTEKQKAELEKLRDLQWHLAKQMDQSENLMQSLALSTNFQRVTYEIYILEMKSQGYTKKQADLEMLEFWAKRGLVLPSTITEKL